MIAYRFHGAYKWSQPFTRSFNNDQEAFKFAEQMDDGVWRASVWKEMGGFWHLWDINREEWIYDPVESSKL
jgi:hypothetical protein